MDITFWNVRIVGHADRIVGVDISETQVEVANKTFQHPSLSFVQVRSSTYLSISCGLHMIMWFNDLSRDTKNCKFKLCPLYLEYSPKVEPQCFRVNNTDFAMQMLLRANLLSKGIILLFVQICMNSNIVFLFSIIAWIAFLLHCSLLQPYSG